MMGMDVCHMMQVADNYGIYPKFAAARKNAALLTVLRGEGIAKHARMVLQFLSQHAMPRLVLQITRALQFLFLRRGLTQQLG